MNERANQSILAHGAVAGPTTLFVGRASPARLIDLGHSPGTVADEIPQVDLTGRISCTLR